MTAGTDDRTGGLVTSFRTQVGVPAVGVSVVDADGVAARLVLGSRRRDRTDPATVDDQWHIGSCGKAITAALDAWLVERGATAWDLPLRELLGDLAGEMDPAWAGPTVDEALVCQAGIRANLGRDGMRRAYRDQRSATRQRTAAVLAALREPPRERGRFHYSNLSYVVIGAVIDRVAGTPFEDALRTHLLEPLGITWVGVGAPPLVWGHRPRAQLGSLVIGRGAPADPRSRDADNPPVLTPAGRFHVSLADWGTFQRVFLSFGQQGSNTLWSATALIRAC